MNKAFLSAVSAAALILTAGAASAQEAAAEVVSQATVTTGTRILHTSGSEVGTVESVDADGIVVASGDIRVKMPFRSFTRTDDGLLVAMTREELHAAVAAQAQAGPAPDQIVAATPADIRPGVQVRDTQGGLVGTVETVEADGAVVSTGNVRVMLPLNSFGKNSQGLVLGMTRAELEAQAGS